MIISLDARKVFDKMKHAFMVKLIERVGNTGGNILSTKIILKSEKLEVISLKSGKRAG